MALGAAAVQVLHAQASPKAYIVTKTEVLDRVGGNRDHRRKAFAALTDTNRIEHNEIARTEAGVPKKRPLWGITTNPTGGWSRAIRSG